MISIETRRLIEANKLEARRRNLQRFDLTDFSRVPAHIINSFYDRPSYLKRLFVSVFAYINGLSYDQLISILFWKPRRQSDDDKIKYLYDVTFKKERYMKEYFSYSTIRNAVVYIDGALRLYGRRVE